jgi:hypothetical protein
VDYPRGGKKQLNGYEKPLDFFQTIFYNLTLNKQRIKERKMFYLRWAHQ